MGEYGRSKKRLWSGWATLHEPDFSKPSGRAHTGIGRGARVLENPGKSRAELPLTPFGTTDIIFGYTLAQKS